MSRREGGWSLVELAVSVSFVVIGVLGLALGMFRAANLQEETRENCLLSQTFRNILAEVQKVPFSSVTTTFGPSSGKDKFWCAEDGGVYFSPPKKYEASGQIQFFTQESAVPKVLSGLTGSLDLSGNGTIDLFPVTDYKVLPVRLTLTLDRSEGSTTHVADFLLTDSGASSL